MQMNSQFRKTMKTSKHRSHFLEIECFFASCQTFVAIVYRFRIRNGVQYEVQSPDDFSLVAITFPLKLGKKKEYNKLFCCCLSRFFH